MLCLVVLCLLKPPLVLYVTLHGKTVNKVIAHARHGPNTFARYLSNTLSVRICKKKKTKEIE